MLTARGEEADRVAGLELGADDYVVKPFSARELVARVRAVLRRVAEAGEQRPEGAIEVGEVRLDADRRSTTFQGDELELSRKEFDLLRLLMENAGSVVTRERLIDEVWDTNWFGSTKTLDVHVSGLRKKLGDDSADPRYIHTVRGVGFRFAGTDELMSLRTRLLAAFAYVLILVIVALEVPLILNVSRRVDAEVKAQAAAEAQLVAASAAAELGSGDDRDLQRIAERAAEESGGRVLVVDRQGRVVADSAGQTGNYGDRPEIRAALDGEVSQGRRFSDTLGETLLFTAVPVVVGGDVGGAVRVTQSVDAIDRRVRRDVLGLIGIGLIALVLGLAFAWFLAGTLARPLQRLAATARRVEAGDLGARAEPEGSTGEPRGRARLQRHDRAAGAGARRPAGVRRERVAPAADAAHRSAAPARGGVAQGRAGARAPSSRPPSARSSGSRAC